MERLFENKRFVRYRANLELQGKLKCLIFKGLLLVLLL